LHYYVHELCLLTWIYQVENYANIFPVIRIYEYTPRICGYFLHNQQESGPTLCSPCHITRISVFCASRLSRQTVSDLPCDSYAFCDGQTVIAGVCANNALTNVLIVVGMSGKNVFWSAEWFTLRWNRLIEYR